MKEKKVWIWFGPKGDDPVACVLECVMFVVNRDDRCLLPDQSSDATEKNSNKKKQKLKKKTICIYFRFNIEIKWSTFW